MSIPKWTTVKLSDLTVPDAGWRYDDAQLDEKLATSLRRHGQLRPVVVCRRDGAIVVVDGRRMLRVMTALGWDKAHAVDMGTIDPYAAQQVALDLELRYATDFVKVAVAVAGLIEQGVAPASLSAASPFSPARIEHFRTLATWDWSQFSSVPAGQAALSWDDLPAEEPAPAVLPPVVPHRRADDPVVVEVHPEIAPMEAAVPEPEPAPDVAPQTEAPAAAEHANMQLGLF